MAENVWWHPATVLKLNINLSSDKETSKDLPSDSEAFEVEQVLSLIISYLGGKKKKKKKNSLCIFDLLLLLPVNIQFCKLVTVLVTICTVNISVSSSFSVRLFLIWF